MINEAKMAGVRWWDDTPESLREQLVELVKTNDVLEIQTAINLYRGCHGTTYGEAKMAVNCLIAALVPVVPCPSCGMPLRTQLAQQCLECGADWHTQQPPATRS